VGFFLFSNLGVMRKVFLGALVVLSLFAASTASAAGSAVTVTGPTGQKFSAAQTRLVPDGTKVAVTGKGYNTKVGIYVTYCVIPAKGVRPSDCGPFDISGQNNASVWVSSNPPAYAALLVKPFAKGGSFKLSIKVTRMIGKFDCKKVRCALTTRADHTNGSYRKADVFIPITIK
jgi:hypothetical protein